MNTSVVQWSRELTQRARIPARSDFLLRHYHGPSDIARWLNLRREAFADSTLAVRAWTTGDFAREVLAKGWFRPDRVWLAEKGVGTLFPGVGGSGAGERKKSPDPFFSRELAGAVILAQRGPADGGVPAIGWLMVAPAHRRQGLGSQLLAAAEAKAWDLGHRRVVLESHTAWQAAARLYAARGYTRSGSSS